MLFRQWMPFLASLPADEQVLSHAWNQELERRLYLERLLVTEMITWPFVVSSKIKMVAQATVTILKGNIHLFKELR